MKIKRDILIQHLQRIACSGQITEAVFTGAFATTALTPDQLLLCIAPPLPKTRVLVKKGEEVGIAELGMFMKALGVLAGVGTEAVSVEIRLEEHRLVVDEEHRGMLRLLTAAPKTIGTRVDEDVAQKIVAKAPEGKDGGIPLTRALVDGIRGTFALLKAEEIELTVGPAGGTIRVGGDNANTAEFASDTLKAPTEYTLLFGEHFVDVLSVITNYSEAMLYLSGPGKIILIDDDGYKYFLNPRSPGADA